MEKTKKNLRSTNSVEKKSGRQNFFTDSNVNFKNKKLIIIIEHACEHLQCKTCIKNLTDAKKNIKLRMNSIFNSVPPESDRDKNLWIHVRLKNNWGDCRVTFPFFFIENGLVVENGKNRARSK